MSEILTHVLDSSQLVFYLQRVNQLAQKLSGCLDPGVIAASVTAGLVENFDCVFARLWLVEPDAKTLRLISSSGLSTRTDGEFSRVAMGAYKVGKIAQNRVAFLSNNLVEEPWVKDRDWAIANQIQGFVGYPLTISDRVVGVLATFSQQPMATEFLEVLQLLCTTVAVALETALKYQQEKQIWQSLSAMPSFHQLVLSDQLAHLFDAGRLSLVGTEKVLPLSVSNLVLQLADSLRPMDCLSCRLIYRKDVVVFEALIAAPEIPITNLQAFLLSHFDQLELAVNCLGGTLQSQMDEHQRVMQVVLTVPDVVQSKQSSPLSEREQEIFILLSQGLRDRDIAARLIISESTVKFHINNAIKKLKAQTRFQALYQGIVKGWLA